MFKADSELFTVFKTSKLIAGALLDVRVNSLGSLQRIGNSFLWST